MPSSRYGVGGQRQSLFIPISVLFAYDAIHAGFSFEGAEQRIKLNDLVAGEELTYSGTE
jgi:hypothetical protein